MFPVLDPKHKTRIVDEILQTILADNVKARVLQLNGRYVRRQQADGEAPVREQIVLQDIASRAARAKRKARTSAQAVLQHPSGGVDSLKSPV
jgi:polyphosphate kinase